jgi:AraC-like DNA-binding protein
MLNRRLDDAIPFEWHHHPEFELTLTRNSRGQRFVGNHVDSYDDGDLVLIGPNLPHTWASREKLDETQPHVALVFWFSQAWIERLTDDVLELRPIRRLIDRAAAGLAFKREFGLALADNFEAVYAQPPAQRLLKLFDILLRIADADDTSPLSTAVPRQGDGSRLRIDRVLQHLHQSYHQPLCMEELAEIAALSVSGLHRMFRKHTQTNVSAYLIGLRIGEACSLLVSSNQPVQHIAAEVGYASLANFNRQFRKLRRMSPREYRALFR